MTVAAIAPAVGCSASNVYKIEQGRAQPSPPLYSSLKAVLKVGDQALTVDAAEVPVPADAASAT